jgi:hypothetical protein
VRTVSSSGTYKFTATTSCGSFSDSIQVFVRPYPVVNIAAIDSFICPGGSVVLAASGANTYAWSPGTGLNTVTGNVVTASPAVNTMYTVTGTTNGCSSSKNINITVRPALTPTISTTYMGCPSTALQFTAITSNGGTGTITWFVNNTASGTGNTFTLNNAVNGMQVYARLVSNVICATPQTVNSATTTINCITTALPNIDGLTALTAAPNPTTGVVYLQLQLTSAKKVFVEVWDAGGKKLATLNPKTLSGTSSIPVHLEGYAAGTYFLKVFVGNKFKMLPVVVNR